ncbi:MAG TPA: hypothetical protein VHD36_13965 [Pirellulales bacterium]|nr:hypothetical protein [Pirellulales bacterium]
MAQRRKKASKAAAADRGARATAAGAFKPAYRGPTEPERPLTWRELSRVPPRPHMAFLIGSAVGLAAWMTFLLAMAAYW